MALGIGYGLPFVAQHGTNPYKTQWAAAREGAKGAGASVEDENAGVGSCLVSRGQDVYTDGLPSTPSLLIVPQFYKAGNLYQDVPPFVAEDSTMRFTVSRNTTATRVNSSGLIESVASGVPRIDWLGQSCPALLVEASGSNQIRNNSMVGAVTGSPGTLPTNWGETAGGNLPYEVVGVGADNGVQYVDLRFSGTASGTLIAIRFEAGSQIVAANGQTWTESAWLGVISAPQPPSSYLLRIDERTAAGGFVVGGDQAIVPTSTLTRFSFTRTLSGGATVERVQPLLRITIVSGQSYNFTIRIGYPQMEQSPFATSVIPTTTAAVSRAADVISASGALVSGLIGQTEGTMYAEVDIQNLSEGRIFTLFNSATRYIVLSKATSRLAGSVIDTTSSPITVVSLQTASGSLTAGTYKLALAYASGNFAFYVNGTQVATSSTGGVIGGYTSVRLGNFDTSLFFNDRIRAAALYTTRLSNDQLAELTRL